MGITKPKRIAGLFVLIITIASAMTLTGCEVIGYNAPVVTQHFGAWQTKQSTDPLTGDNLVTVQTKTRPNSFFGKLMSIFGQPSLSVSCIQGGPDNDKIKATIDWREAVGPANIDRQVQSRFDGGNIIKQKWATSPSGRQSSRKVQETGYVDKIKKANTLAVRTTNSAGTPVTLVFNVRGFGNAYNAIPASCQ